jgi:hypothetical protein
VDYKALVELVTMNAQLVGLVSNNIAAGFKNVIVAGSGCTLWEVDSNAVEAVLSGYFMRDPNFIRLAKLGIHDYHASHIIKKPANLSWDDKKLGSYLKEIKKELEFNKSTQRPKSKQIIYQSLYGASAYGVQKTYSELFPTVRDAEENQQLLYDICPKLKLWHNDLRMLAHYQGYLGGKPDMGKFAWLVGKGFVNNANPDDWIHPFLYKHWFWDVFTWNSAKNDWKNGSDSKRVVAYYPQSTNAGFQKESALELMTPGENYIGDTYFGQTPIRAPIHDSLLGESENKHLGSVLTKLYRVMTRSVKELPCPQEWNLGSHLTIGASAKIGQSWGDMKEVKPEDFNNIFTVLGTAPDFNVREFEEDEETA